MHGDARGWFKENWQRAKMCALGLPDLGPVQNNISFNAERGVTRGIHAEPWDKYISVATGSVFGAWVDLRPGKSFGEVYTCVIDPSKAIYVPRGVGNSFQALEDGTAYTYLVNAHWSAELKKTYTFVNLADPGLGIEWPIPLSECELSEADRDHPMLADALPMAPRRTLVTGCNGQLGRAVRAPPRSAASPGFDYCDIDTFDLSRPEDYEKYDWSLYGAVINCGAYTAVDRAETPEGRRACWAANATGPALMARTCAEHGVTLVHVSSDYVFDGASLNHAEDEPLSAAVRLRPVQGRRRPRRGRLSQTLRRAQLLGDRRRPELRQDHEGALRPGGGPRGRAREGHSGRRPARPSHLHRPDGRRHPAPARLPRRRPGALRARPLRHLQPHRLRPRGVLGAGRGPRLRPGQRQRRRGRARLHRRVLRLRRGPDRPEADPSDLDLSKVRAAGFEPRDWTEELAEYMETL